jgi:DNA helicase-2/ATP-dependent DNA helicase PcrA
MDRTDYLKGITEGTVIKINESESDNSEADWIAREIVKLLGGVRSLSIERGITDGENKNYGFGDFAVLCRASFMFDPIIKAFDSHGIPYQMIDNDPFYMKEPYKSPFKAIRECYLSLKRGDEIRGNHLFEMIKSGESLSSTAQHLLKNQPEEYDEDKVARFTQGIKDYDEFIRLYNLRSGVDDYKPEFEAVPVITIHSAKGLEFKTVFIPGCDESIIPFSLFGKDDKRDDSAERVAESLTDFKTDDPNANENKENDVDEERRIFYVALTRSKERLYLSHARKRLFRGRILTLKKSRFLEKISSELVKIEKREQKTKKKDDNQLTMF